MDVCIAFQKLFCSFEFFTVYNGLSHPLDYPPITFIMPPPVEDRKSLELRARPLGEYATLYFKC